MRIFFLVLLSLCTAATSLVVAGSERDPATVGVNSAPPEATIHGQTIFVERLCGVSLGQYRESVVNYFGAALDEGRYPTGESYQVFRPKSEDQSCRLTVTYADGNREEIKSLSIAGSSSNNIYLGLKLGSSQQDVSTMLGAPTTLEKIGDTLGEIWYYAHANYSLTIDHNGSLSSVMVSDESENLFDHIEGIEPPDISLLAMLVKNNDRQALLPYLSPDFEILDSLNVLSFEMPVEHEVVCDFSGIFSTLADPEIGFTKLERLGSDSYELLLKPSGSRTPLQVYRFVNQDFPIQELIFKRRFGRYQLWEIRLR